MRLREPVSPIPFPGVSRRAVRRVAPGDRAQLGLLNAAICRALGLASGGRPLHVFTTLARHRRVFRPWLRFAARLMPFGTLPRADAELVILRVAVLCGSDYEWQQHAVLGQRAGLSPYEVRRVADGPGAPGWSTRRRALLQATDELVAGHVVSDDTWATLLGHVGEQAAIELCLLAGHYVMLAGTLNALGVEPERR